MILYLNRRVGYLLIGSLDLLQSFSNRDHGLYLPGRTIHCEWTCFKFSLLFITLMLFFFLSTYHVIPYYQTKNFLKRFTIRFKSRSVLGPTRVFTFFFLRNSCVILAVCFGSLLCWNISLQPSFWRPRVISSPSFSLYPQAFILPFLNVISLAPFALLQPLVITIPSPCSPCSDQTMIKVMLPIVIGFFSCSLVRSYFTVDVIQRDLHLWVQMIFWS